MQYNRGGIVQIYAEAALPRKIMSSPRRSYAQLQQALALAEAVTERTLCEMLALRQSLQANNSDVADKQQTQQQLHQLIKQSQRTSTGFAVLFVQLDQFRAIYQQHGAVVAKQISDLVLTKLVAAVRACDLVNQRANGQFLILITDVKRIYDAVLVAEKLMQKLGLLDDLCPQPQPISASIGISRFPQDGLEAGLLIERAAAAMSHAESRGGNQFSLLR